MADKMNTAEASALLLAQVDKPYVWGANGPDKFDCSGMFYWWSNATGNARSDTTAQGLYNLSVATNSPRLGDLAFLYSGGYISHVGIMLDSDTVIEARGRAYGVDKTPLSSFKNRSGYVWKGTRRMSTFALSASPVATVGTNFRAAGLNCLDPNIHQGTPVKLWPLTASRIAALVKVTRQARADFYGLTEAPEDTRDEIRAGMTGGADEWLVWEHSTQAIMFPKSRYINDGKKYPVDFEGKWGGVVAALTNRKTGHKFVVGAYHLPPNSLTSDATQQKYLAKFIAEMERHDGTRILIGDGMDTAAWASGWDDSRIEAKASSTRNMFTYGTSYPDKIMAPKSTVEWRGYNVLGAGVGSDHDLIVAAGTVQK